MDILLKDVEVNSGYITLTCPMCGADVHVHSDDAEELYWLVRSFDVYSKSKSPRFIDGRCKTCGCKE